MIGSRTVRVAVCVPVRNEEATLPAFLRAVARQEWSGPALTLCVHFDGCTDASEAIVDRSAARLGLATASSRSPAGPDANAGRARRAAMLLGLDRSGDGDILLSTDADSVPRDDWVMRAVRSLETCDVVAGRVVREDQGASGAQSRVERYYDRLYRYRRAIDPVPWEAGATHHFTGGANLGFRASAYRALGGFPPIACGEDAVMVDDASRAGLRVRRDPAPLVQTSARREGRATGGLAASLRQFDACGGTSARVAHPACASWQYHGHAHARRSFAQLGDPAMANRLSLRLGLSPDHLLGVARDCPNAEAFAMRVVPAAPGSDRLVTLDEAEQALAMLERDVTGKAA